MHNFTAKALRKNIQDVCYAVYSQIILVWILLHNSAVFACSVIPSASILVWYYDWAVIFFSNRDFYIRFYESRETNLRFLMALCMPDEPFAHWNFISPLSNPGKTIICIELAPLPLSGLYRPWALKCPNFAFWKKCCQKLEKLRNLM